MREESFPRRHIPMARGDDDIVRRIIVLGLLAASLGAGSPARAETFNADIMLPDFGTPSIGRLLYTQSNGSVNGLIGYVFRLSAKSSFTLSRVSGATGLESFDIFFYTDDGGQPGTVLDPAYNRCPAQDVFCNKAGPIPANAKWAVVTLVLGADGVFRYSAG